MRWSLKKVLVLVFSYVGLLFLVWGLSSGMIFDFLHQQEAKILFYITGQEASGEVGLREIIQHIAQAGTLEPLKGAELWGVLLALAISTFVSEDLACMASGFLAATGAINFSEAVFASFLGIFVGDSFIYFAGYLFGEGILKHRIIRYFLSERAVHRAEVLFMKRGMILVFLTRFIPGTRTATYFAAGALRTPILPFLSVFALAALIWTPLLVGFSLMVGEQLVACYDIVEGYALPAIILIVLILYLVFHYGIPLLTWKGRRLLKGGWIRATQWEFWSIWKVNWLIVLYVLYLGFIKFRRPMLFTATNPCMPHSGFVGESKSAILRGLSERGDAVPKWTLLPDTNQSERLVFIESWMLENRIDWPVVFKPDEGQRGLGVEVVKNRIQAQTWLSTMRGPAITQAFVEGEEFGVFYYRLPFEDKGKIFSLTIKQQLEVRGDGVSCIEKLILNHPRAIALAKVFLERYRERLDDVLEPGEVLKLGELGTHARGALFLDGSHLITDALVTEIDFISRNYKGFYFGRYDIRTKNQESLKRGEGLKVIELNGITSEATHIYDPKNSLFYAWSVLRKQWKIAYEIGDANVARGVPMSTLREFCRDLWKATQRQKKIGS